MRSLSWMPGFEADLKNRSDHFEIHLELTSSQYLREFMTTGRDFERVCMDHYISASTLDRMRKKFFWRSNGTSSHFGAAIANA